MNKVLSHNLFFVKEHRGIFKAANNYDILDPHSQELMMTCREENLGAFTKILRFTDYKRNTPFEIEIRTASGDLVLTVKRGISLFVSTVEVFDGQNQLVGTFKQKFFSLGGKFELFDASENFLCMLKGKWTGWDFRFVKDDFQFAHVSKKWAGLGREMFTSADNYMLEIDEAVPADSPIRMMILAAIMCIDMVLKE